MPVTAGMRLGSYEVVSPLGAGGMGEVYRARCSNVEVSGSAAVCNGSAGTGAFGRAEGLGVARERAQRQSPREARMRPTLMARDAGESFIGRR